MEKYENDSDPDIETARNVANEAEVLVSETRVKMQKQIEYNEMKAESLRDQASIYADATRTLRQFVYGSEGPVKDNVDYSNDHVPAGIT